MPVFRTILFAADFSESSREAFRVVSSLARGGEARVHVLHVLEAVHVAEEPVYFGQQSVQYSAAETGRGYRESVKERLRRFYVPDRPIEAEYHTRDGSPAEEILCMAEEAGCDLIVMATHGRTGLSRLLAGSVAEAVLRRACCPVLALRAPGPRKEAGRVEVILHPTDFSERSEFTLRTARALAQDRGARLVLVHVMPLEVVIYGSIPVPLDVRAVRDSLAAVASGVDGPDLKYPVETRLAEGNAAAAILRVAEEVGCGLIVMGTHGRTGLGRLLMGSVTEAVLRGAGCPVLAVKTLHPESVPALGEPCTGGVTV